MMLYNTCAQCGVGLNLSYVIAILCDDCDKAIAYDPFAQEEPFDMTKPKTPSCDCGALKVKTTHSTWCSIRHESRM